MATASHLGAQQGARGFVCVASAFAAAMGGGPGGGGGGGLRPRFPRGGEPGIVVVLAFTGAAVDGGSDAERLRSTSSDSSSE